MADYSKAVKLLKETLDQTNPEIAKNTKIVTPDDLKQDYLLHIAKTNFKYLVPNISKRAGAKEDNTLPRIHTAPSLFGCIEGYAIMSYDILYEKATTKKTADYLGGYYIYKIPFEAALRPNKKMVYDADYTQEHWVVAYSKETRIYEAEIIGRIIPSVYTFEPTSKKTAVSIAELVMELKEPIHFDYHTKETLDKGYWKFQHHTTIKNDTSSEARLTKPVIIQEQEYKMIKDRAASMLSY